MFSPRRMHGQKKALRVTHLLSNDTSMCDSVLRLATVEQTGLKALHDTRASGSADIRPGGNHSPAGQWYAYTGLGFREFTRFSSTDRFISDHGETSADQVDR